MTRPQLPPKYVNVSTPLLFAANVSPVAFHTYCQLKAMAWGKGDETNLLLSPDEFFTLTGKSKSTLYGHLNHLRESGVLRFTSPRLGDWKVVFAQDDSCFKNLKLPYMFSILNEDVTMINSDHQEGGVGGGFQDFETSQNSETPPMPKRTAEEVKASLTRTLDRTMVGQANKYDLANFPEEIRPYLQAFCEAWKIPPPARTKNRTGAFADWTASGYKLAEICNGLGVEPIRREWARHKEHMTNRGGTLPYDVARPGSILNSVTARAVELRHAQSYQVVNSDGSFNV